MKRQLSNGSPMKTSPVREKRIKSESLDAAHAFKTVNGELVDKNMISLNNEPYYILKFLVDNSNSDYYGNMEQYNNMIIGKTYKMCLVYMNRRLIISKYELVDEPEIRMEVKRQLTYADFLENNIVCVEAQFRCGFKVLMQSYFKMLFNIRYVNEHGNLLVVQVESVCDLNRMLHLFKVDNDSDLIRVMMESQDKYYRLSRVKSTNSKKNYKSISFSESSRMEEIEDGGDVAMSFDDEQSNQVNISRSNKEVFYGKLKSIRVCSDSPPNIKVLYSVDGHEDTVNGTIYMNERNRERSDEFTKLTTDLKQTADTLNQFNEMYIYTTNDGNEYYSVIGITCFDMTIQKYIPL